MKLPGPRTVCRAATALAVMAVASSAMAADADNRPLPITKDTSWHLRLPKDEKVAYKGMVSYDAAGVNSAQILYPAPNALGFLAAVFTHGAIVESQKKSEKERLQQEADKVLAPFEAILNDYRHRELMQRAIEKMGAGERMRLVPADHAGGEWVVVSIPSFTMMQDQSAIILENAVALFPPDSKEPAYRNAVRVVSRTQEGADLTAFWSANGGVKLKEESAGLLAHSLEIAMADAATAPDVLGPQKTFRFREGREERIERANLVNERCDRMIIKTLRGWLMSVPARASSAASADDSCRAAADNAKPAG